MAKVARGFAEGREAAARAALSRTRDDFPEARGRGGTPPSAADGPASGVNRPGAARLGPAATRDDPGNTHAAANTTHPQAEAAEPLEPHRRPTRPLAPIPQLPPPPRPPCPLRVVSTVQLPRLFNLTSSLRLPALTQLAAAPPEPPARRLGWPAQVYLAGRGRGVRRKAADPPSSKAQAQSEKRRKGGAAARCARDRNP